MSIAPDEDGALLREVLMARGGSQPVLDVLNDFYEFKVAEILASSTMTTNDGRIITFSNPFYTLPTVNDLKGQGRPRPLFPFEARRSRHSYFSELHARLELKESIGGELVSVPGESVDVHLGKVPVAVGSMLCRTHGMTQDEAYAHGEAKRDPKGYFIIKGSEKVLLNIDKLRYLSPYLYENKGVFMVRYTSQTLTDTTIASVFENRYDLQLSFTRLGSKTGINIFYIFYVLGVTRDTIESVFTLVDTFITDKNPQRQERRRREMRQFMQTTVNTFISQTSFDERRVFEILAGVFKDQEIINSPRRNALIKETIQSELFKNISYENLGALSPEERQRQQVAVVSAKIRLLAYMMAKYCDFANGYRGVDDRDAWGNKQLVDPGRHMLTRFVQIWRQMVTNIQAKIRTSGLTTANEIRSAISQSYMTEQFVSSFNKDLWSNSRGNKDTTVVEVLKRDNLIAAHAHIRRMRTPTNKRAQIREKRLIHPTQWGVACPTMTPEGEACLSLDTLVTLADGRELPIGELKNGDKVISIDPTTMEQSVTTVYDHFIKCSKAYGASMLKVVAGKRHVVCTDDHAFLTQQGWVEAGKLDKQLHRLAVFPEKEFVKIDSVTPQPPCLVSDFTTASSNHSMVSNGFVTHNCGLTRDSAITAYVSIERDPSLIRTVVAGDLVQRPTGNQTDLFALNGVILGYCNSRLLKQKLVAMRRTQQIYFDTGIILNTDEELWVFTSGNRVCRPVMTVNPNTQRLLIDEIPGLREKATFDTLLSSGVMEYIDSSEQEQIDLFIATSTRQLRDRRERNEETKRRYAQLLDDPNATREEIESSRVAMASIAKERKYTHAEIDPTVILGISAITMPFTEFNPGPRNTYQTSMVKQALGANASRIELRFDTTMRMLIEPNVPTVATDAEEWLSLDEFPQGQQLILAITTYGGNNQEDAIIMNQDAVDRGFFNMMIYHSYKTTICQSKGHHEKIQVPDYPPSRADKYSKLDPETGIVRVGETVGPKDCLVGKVVIETATGKVSNDSLYMEVGKEGVVDEVFITNNTDACKLILIRVREMRKIQEGDKVASRYAQKSIIGSVMPGRQFPWISSEKRELNGVRPHAIFNPHGIPSRMTVGKMFEMLTGKMAAIKGERESATAFRRFSIDTVQDEMANLGFTRSGKERMINGITGREMDVDIYVGPAYYQLLRLVKDKMQARQTGSVQFLTRQPNSGIRKEGGLRLGEMERDALIEHGAAYLTQERMSISSDAWQGIFCKSCGQMAISHVEQGTFRCRLCRDEGEFTRLVIPFATKLLIQLMWAVNGNITLRTKEL